MKSVCIYSLIVVLSSLLVQAGFELPRHVYRAEKFTEAVITAKEENKAIAFVLSDEKST